MRSTPRIAVALAAGSLLALGVAAAPAVGEPTSTLPTVSSTTMLGPVHQNARVDARDNGQSVQYQGRSLWFFDDTILQDPFDFLSSTAAVTSDLDASDGIDLLSSNVFDEQSTGAPTNFVPYSAAETAFQDAHAAADCTDSSDPYCGTVFAFWPGAVVTDPARHRVLVSYGKLCRGGREGTPCASGFIGQGIGAGFAEVDLRAHTVTRMVAEHRTADLPSPEGADDTIFFSLDDDWGGAGLVRDGNTLYAYGRCTGSGCGVARVPIDRVQDLSAWRYYAGDRDGQPRWSTDAADAVVAIGQGSAGGTLSADPLFGGYLHTYMPALSKTTLYQSAPHPWGPWSTPKTLYTAPDNSGVTYAAYGHPEYDSSDGLTKYFTYYDAATGDQMLVRVDFAAGGANR